MIQDNPNTKAYFLAHKIKKCQNQSPDMQQFKKHKLNVFVMTRNGRPIFARYGNQIKCSSFLATFSAIAGKINKFYHDSPETQTMHKINQGKLTIYLIKRKYINILCISKSKHDELKILSMMDFVNMQLISCFTDRLNTILSDKQGYDPTSNFNPTTVNLLSSSIKNGLQSPCMFLNAIPVLSLSSQHRSQLFSMMKDIKTQSLQLFILMTMTQVVGIFKKKQIDIYPQDVFLLFNLFHTQKSLRNTENWFPICLPGIQENGQLFCYSSFITEHLIVVMLTDESDDFSVFNQSSKLFKQKIGQSEVNKRINKILSKPQIIQLKIDKIQYLEHFLIKNNESNQVIMQHGNYFGINTPEFKKIINNYARIHRTQLLLNCNKKQKVQFQQTQDGVICEYVISNYTIFFAGRQIINLEDSKVILQGIYKWLRDEESNLFISKYQ